MYKHIRKYVPGHYKQLVKDWPAISKWGDLDYLKFIIGDEIVDGIHYSTGFPFRNFAGGYVFTNQRGVYQTFPDFLNVY